jgi:hypothetical protein
VGHGIPKECEIGMAFSELELNRRNFQVETQFFTKSLAGSFLSRGISVHASRSNGIINLIDFLVDPMVASNRFDGAVDGLRFAQGRFVSRSNVVEKFGPLPRYSMTNLSVAQERLVGGKDGAVETAPDSEMLYYVTKGIMFELQRKTVVRFSIIPVLSTNIGAGY